MSAFEPAYLALLRSGELKRRVEAAYERLRDAISAAASAARIVTSSPGACQTGVRALVASSGPHHGEETPLRGYRGSGTIFFTWCNLSCQFCQNYDISQLGHGEEVEPEDIASTMLALQSRGCHNVNLVSPTHVVAPILAALLVAAEAGLRLPLVWNTGGYDSLAALALLDGVVDIYMPGYKVCRRGDGPQVFPGQGLSGGQPGRRQRDAPPGGRSDAGRKRHRAAGVAGAASGAAWGAGRDGLSCPFPGGRGLARYVHQRDGSIPALLQRRRVRAARPAYHGRGVQPGYAAGSRGRLAPFRREGEPLSPYPVGSLNGGRKEKKRPPPKLVCTRSSTGACRGLTFAITPRASLNVWA